MTAIPVLEKEREQLAIRIKAALEENRNDDFDELEGKIKDIDKQISRQTFVDQLSVKKAPDKEEANLATRIQRDYNLGKALKQSKTGLMDGLENEVNAHLKEQVGNEDHPDNAVLLPNELLATRAVTATTAGPMIATTDYRPSEYLPTLRSRSIAMALGARQIQGVSSKVRIPRQGGPTTAEWRSEVQTSTEQTAVFLAPLEFEAHRMTYYTQISDQAIRESGMGLPIQQIVVDEAQAALADKIDSSVFSFNGTGQAVTTQETHAPDQLWKVGTVGSIARTARTADTNGKALTYTELLALKRGSTDQQNMPMMRPGFASNFYVHDKLKETLRIASNTNSDTIIPANSSMIDGYPSQFSTRITSTFKRGTGNCSPVLYSTDWQYLVFCMWGNQSLIVDQYTAAPSGQVRLIWHAFLDYKILRDDAFSWYDSVLTA